MRRFFYIVFFILAGISAAGQTLEDLVDDFNRFAERTDREFEAFRRRTQKEFGEFLKQSWQEYPLMPGEEWTTAPEPAVAQIAEPETFNTMVRLHAETGATGGHVSPSRTAPPLPKPSTNNPSAKYDDTDFSFFGSQVSLPIDRKFSGRLRLRSAGEKDVGDFWIKLADADFLLLIYSCGTVREKLSLNDWGYYRLVCEVAKQVYPSATMDGERTVFTAFILDETGYDVRIARNADNGRLALMTVFDSNLYFTPYLELSGKRYHNPEERNNRQRIITYPPYAKTGEKRRMDLRIRQPLKLKDNPATFDIPSEVIGVPLKITYNRNAVDFYSTVPVTGMEVYFNSRGSTTVLQSFEEALKPVVGKMNETDAAATLLRMMHHAFKYKTDREQFGYERPFFLEELFSFPYNNCKDRSVLFAFLVRQLLGLPVVGLKYPGHVATAVRFNGRVNGHYVSVGEDVYVICDPTYINASIGQAMSEYATVKAETVIIEN